MLERALVLAKSEDPLARARAADILGQLGTPERTFPDECLTAVIGLAASDIHPRVLQAAAVALGHLRNPRRTDVLARLSDHSDPKVRHAVAFALGGCEDPQAIEILIELMHDPIAIVRDWATFRIGQLQSGDTLEIRQALYERLSDADQDTRFEAISGLARRGDLRSGPPLIEALRLCPENSELWLPAAALLKINLDEYDPSAEALIEAIERVLASKT